MHLKIGQDTPTPQMWRRLVKRPEPPSSVPYPSLRALSTPECACRGKENEDVFLGARCGRGNLLQLSETPSTLLAERVALFWELKSVVCSP